jgi:hypothetical protein
MGKKTPQAPTPPDPVKTAAAQGAINKETAITQANLNRIDEFTPYGTSTWSQQSPAKSTREAIYAPDIQVAGRYGDSGGRGEPDENGDYGPGQGQWIPGYTQKGAITGYKDVPGVYDPNDPSQRWRRTTTLDPEQQKIFDLENSTRGEFNQLAYDQVGRVAESLKSPFNYDGIVGGGSTQGAEDAARRFSDRANSDYNYDGQPAGPNSGRIVEAADAARDIASNRFNYDGLPEGSNTRGAEAAVGRVTDAYGTPLNYDDAPAAARADSAARQQVIDSMYGQSTSRLDPRFAGELKQKETQLANSGIARGSEAFSASMDDFYRGRNDAYQGAQNSAVQAGGAEQSRLFGLQSAARNSAINEQNYLRRNIGYEQGQLLNYEQQLGGMQDSVRQRGARERMNTRAVGMGEQQQLQNMYGTSYGFQASDRDRGIAEQDSLRNRYLTEQNQNYNMQSGLFGLQQGARQRQIEERGFLRGRALNEASALMSGNQIMNPSFGAAPNTAVANTDYSGLVQNQYAGQQNQYNQQVAANNSKRAAVASMAGTLGKMAITSDRRVKQNITKVGTLDNGLPIYSFQYIWGGPQQIGLMAQDVEKVNPSAVSEDENGIKAVNYSEAVK